MNVSTELMLDECLELLHAEVVGRVGLQTPVGPRIIPVNYSMYGDAIVWRTLPFSELASYGNDMDVAFEVDQIDRDTRTGWDVVALGRVRIVTDLQEIADIRRVEDPAPWAQGLRNLYMSLRWRDLRGRRIGAPTDEPLLSGPLPLRPGTTV